MKSIFLTNGLEVIVDDLDFEFLSRHVWQAFKRHNTTYAVRETRRNGVRKRFSMHREILGISDSKMIVDHRDGNGLNNTRNNLRICSHAENMRNRRMSAKSKTGFKGVVSHKPTGKFLAQIRVNKKGIYLGLFKEAHEAAKAYDSAAKIHHGQFANLNFPEQ